MRIVNAIRAHIFLFCAIAGIFLSATLAFAVVRDGPNQNGVQQLVLDFTNAPGYATYESWLRTRLRALGVRKVLFVQQIPTKPQRVQLQRLTYEPSGNTKVVRLVEYSPSVIDKYVCSRVLPTPPGCFGLAEFVDRHEYSVALIEPENVSPLERKVLLLHEIGHVLGYKHTKSCGVMYPVLAAKLCDNPWKMSGSSRQRQQN